jgi:hypothetical protein
MAGFVDTPPVTEWLQQFDAGDRPAARRLVSAITLVSLDDFFSSLRARVILESETTQSPVGIYVEREIRKWKGQPNRLFKEMKQRGHVVAYGAGPPPVEPARNVNPEVGSEGLLAWLAT